MAAQPFRDGERRSERQQPFRPAHPDQAGRCHAQCSEDREISRQSRYSDRQQPAERFGVDQKSMADPV